MSDQDRNNPLHGVGLDAMFSEILRHYHWEILSEQLKFKCLENHPSFAAATKFLKKTKWAREKTEAFYLYKFKQLPIPSDEEHLLPPRERHFAAGNELKEPAEIKVGDKQFFDDPVSGPKFSEGSFGDKKPPRTRAASKTKPRPIDANHKPEGYEPKSRANDSSDKSTPEPSNEASKGAADPWAKWK
jgi:uncharacterized protein (DUF2132 family)